MKSEELRSLQAPLKERYRDSPEAARVTLSAEGRIGTGISCKVGTGKALVEAGLHPATGGNGLMACSGDMLLEALVACAGVTLGAVATALGIEIREGTVRATGDLDFRGTLGVSKDTPVGFQRIRLHFDLATDATEDQITTLIRLTERYCVVYQTLRHCPDISVSHGPRGIWKGVRNHSRRVAGWVFLTLSLHGWTIRTIRTKRTSTCKKGNSLMGHLPASKAREGFADTINRVAFGKERVVLRRRGKEVAAVVPIDDLRLLEDLEDRIDLIDARAALAETRKKGAKPLDTILKDLGL
jgi:prevent-host-death family protein